MAETTDIREWLRQQGKDVGDRGRIPKDLRAEYDAAQGNGDEPLVAVPDPEPETPPNPTIPTGQSGTPPTGGGQEIPPSPGKRRGLWPRRPSTTDQSPPRGKDRARKRVPLENWAARGWKMLAYITGAGNTPTSRCLNMQAPVAGIVLDDMIKGTVVDRLAQPLARWGESGKNMGALVGLPLLVAATERQPQIYQWTRPLMAEAATEWVLIAGPAMRKAKARAAEVAKELAEFELDEDAVEGMFQHAAENPVIVKMLDAIFAPMMTPAPEPEKAAA